VGLATKPRLAEPPAALQVTPAGELSLIQISATPEENVKTGTVPHHTVTGAKKIRIPPSLINILIR